jgi:hypothetical protein
MTLHFLAKFIKNQYITEIEIDGDFVDKSIVHIIIGANKYFVQRTM